MNEAINLKQALKIIELKNSEGFPIPFDITFRTLNRNSKTGGSLRSFSKAKILTSIPKQKISEQKILENLKIAPTFRKDPNHWENRTRNLQKDNGEIFKVNIRLIISINNQKVVY